MTFSDFVEIPGQTLPPGTYVFKLAPTIDRHIVQVWTADESLLIATLMTIPESRHDKPETSIFQLDETPNGSPHTLRAWFYPGNTVGETFIYPDHRYIEPGPPARMSNERPNLSQR